MSGGFTSPHTFPHFNFYGACGLRRHRPHNQLGEYIMDILARIIDNLEFELENLESLIELSKGADIDIHRNYIKAFTIVSHSLATMVKMRSLMDS